MDLARRLWVRLGIRRQLTVFAAASVALPLAVGVFVFANLLARSLTNALTASTAEVAHRVAGHLAEGGVASLQKDLDIPGEYRVQVIDASGQVVFSSNYRYATPLSELRPAPRQVQHEGGLMFWGPGDDNERDLVVAEGVGGRADGSVVLVVTNQRDQHAAVNLTAALLASAIPLSMLVASVVTWWLVGRALRPVERMTDRVAEIRSPIGDDRLPLPVAKDPLRTLGTTMNDMLDRLQGAQRSQRSFISDASHELRSPVASLSGAIEIAQQADDLDTWRELSGLMASEVQRLDSLVQGLLALSRADDSGLALVTTDVDVDDLAEAEVRRLRASGACEVLQEIHPARVEGDAALLRQLLVNLGDNAVRHAEGTVRIAVHVDEHEQVVIAVDDDGAGIDPGDRERVFERFVRLEESRNRDEGGSGLGLAIVAQTVRAHRGTVEVRESDLGGASFVVRLPAA